MDTGWVIALFAGIVGIIFFIIAVLLYIIGSIGLMKLAQNKGIDNAWLAWIPIGNLYILGKIVGSFDIASYNVNKLDLVLPLAAIAYGLLSRIPLIGGLISLLIFVLMIFTFIKLYKMYMPAKYVLYTVLSCIGLFSIMIFLIKDNTAVEVPSIGKPVL